jgi:hypothetical protein
MAARPREQSRKRCEESTIGRSERRARLLTAEDEQLMSQHQKLDVFGEVAASPSQQQLQERRESEISEGKEHSTMLPEPSTGRSKTRTQDPETVREVAKPGHDLVFARARNLRQVASPKAGRRRAVLRTERAF